MRWEGIKLEAWCKSSQAAVDAVATLQEAVKNMNEAFTKSEYAAFTAELKMDDGTATSIVTKSALEDGQWKIESIAPEFDKDGKLVRSAGVVIRNTPQTGGKGNPCQP